LRHVALLKVPIGGSHVQLEPLHQVRWLSIPCVYAADHTASTGFSHIDSAKEVAYEVLQLEVLPGIGHILDLCRKFCKRAVRDHRLPRNPNHPCGVVVKSADYA